MKKNIFFRFLAGLMLAGSLAACSEDIVNTEPEKPATTQGDKLTIEVVTADSKGTTRTDYSISNSLIKATFAEGDEIGVYCMNGTEMVFSNVKFTLNGNHWDAESEVKFNPDYFYYAYYPYKTTGTLTSRSCTFNNAAAPNEDEDDTNTKFSTFLTNWPIATDQSDIEDFRESDLLAARGVNQSIPVVKFTMEHRMALAEIVPSYNRYCYGYNQTQKYTLALAFGANIPYTQNSTHYYIMRPGTATTIGAITIPATESGRFRYSRVDPISGSYSLKYYSDENLTSEISKPSWLTVTSETEDGYLKFIANYSISAGTPISGWTAPSGGSGDLSMMDVSGNSTSRNTANCYMVHKSGTYTIPLVYGNAIKNGATNTQAYAPGGTTGQSYLAAFPRHDGNAITDPWIKNNGITVSSAELLWQDSQNIISACSISGDYLSFTVKAGAPMGNAVIAVKNGSGVIVWSWHIWVCPDLYNSAALSEIGGEGENYHKYNVTPVNLGYVGNLSVTDYTGGTCYVKIIPASSGMAQSFKAEQPTAREYYPTNVGYSPYYQYSRKDPEIPSVAGSNTNRTVYNISNSAVTGLTHETHNATRTIADGIKNPTTHYFNNLDSDPARYGPWNMPYYNLWDATQQGLGNIKTPTVKTVYDPCPAGFCVPSSNLWYYMTNNGSNTGADGSNNWDGTYYGRYWTKDFPRIHFPAAGDRYYSSGTSLSNVTTDGYCWSSSACSGSGAHLVGLYSSYFYWDGYYRAYGFSVRPVREE